MPTQAYRLRIRDANNTLDEVVVTSIRNGTNPYIVNPPSGDGQEVDLLTGAVRTGAYNVEVIDAATGQNPTGTVRIVTNKLYDSDARMQLLSRVAFVEMSEDNGSNWVVWQAGYISSIVQVDAIRYSITVSNTRRVEQTQQVFNWSTALERQLFPKRGCLFGGPVIGGFGAQNNALLSPDSGGWEFTCVGTKEGATADALDTRALASLQLDAVYLQPNFQRQTSFVDKADIDKFNVGMSAFLAQRPPLKTNLLTDQAFWGLNDRDPIHAYPNVRVLLSDANGNQWEGTIRGMFTPLWANSYAAYPNPVDSGQPVIQGRSLGTSRLFVEFTGSSVNASNNITPPLPVNTKLRVRGVSNQVTPQSPLYIDDHPVEIAKKLYQLIGVTVTSASVTAMKSVIGVDTRLACRITEAQTMAEFLEKALFGPFGFAARTTETQVSGQLTPVIEFFSTRDFGTVPPSVTIADNDLVGDTPPSIFDLDEATAVTGFVVTQKNFARWIQQEGSTEVPPSDMLVETSNPWQVLSGDTSTFSTKIVDYNLMGMVHQVDSFVADPEAFALSVAVPGFERFGRGAVASEIRVLRTSSAATAKVGDLVYINASFYPNKNYRIGESNVGARVAQVVRREEQPDCVVLKLVDAGVDNQPAIAPTITIAGSSADPRRVASFTITNAAALNSNGKVSVYIEWATGANAPTGNGTAFIRYEAGRIPTTSVALPSVIPGSKVYVRARTQQPELFPSAWTNWQSVTLQAWPAPTGVTVSEITNGSFSVSWGLGSPANISDTIEVYVYQGSGPPATWSGYRVATLPPATTSNTITGLKANTNYFVGVAFFDSVSQVRGTIASPVSAVTTVSSPTTTAVSPAGFAIISGVSDANLSQGVALALWGASGADRTVIERAPNATYFGIDIPGTYEAIQVVPASTETYVDYLPRDGAKYWYRIKHQRDGKADSSYIPRRYITNYGDADGILAIANGVPANLARPGSAEAVIVPESAYSEANAPYNANLTVNLQWTDTQNRFHYVESRTRYRIKKVWQPWSSWFTSYRNTTTNNVVVDTIIPLNTTNIYQVEWRIWGSDNNGNVSYIRSGNVEWPQNYGVNNAIITLQRQGFNAATNKYEVWWRFFYQRGNNTLDEDGDDNTQQVFTTGVVAAKVRNQAGTVATNVVNVATKTADGWKATWDSTATDQWTYEISVNTAMPSSYYLQFQNTDNVDEQFFAPTYAQTFVAPAASSGGGGSGDVTGPASSTDNALVRFDGTTGKLIQNSSATLSDTGTLTATTGAFTNLSSTNTITGSISGNAATVTNGVYTTGSYSDPSWITSLSGTKVSGNISGNAANVTGTVAVANGGTGQTSYTNGQLLIGNSTGNTLTKATLTAGSGISITNGAGSITIASAGQLTPTTVGANLYTLPDPNAIGFIRINADNTVSALNAAGFRDAIQAFRGDNAQLANTDLNSMLTSGYYWSNTLYNTNTNIPYSNYFVMLNLTQGEGRRAQLWFADTPSTSGGVWWRPRQGDATGWHPWEKFLTSANYGSYALPLGGGTVTGNVYLSANGQGAPGATLRVNGDIVAARGLGSSGVIYLGSGGSTYVYYDGANYFMPNGQLDVNGQRVLNAGNYSSYALPLSGGSVSGAINFTNRVNGVLVNASGTGSADASIAIQQVTAEGWTGIFCDFEPYTGWGFWHDNPNNYFSFTAEASAGSLRSFTVPSRLSGNRTAYEKVRIEQGSGDMRVGGNLYITTSGHLALHAGNYNSYAPSLTGAGASGSSWGISITGNAATATSATNAGTVGGITKNQIFNNMGQTHGNPATFDGVPDFGAYYVQADSSPANGTQYYGFTLGLGSEYSLSQYAMQIAIPRIASWNTTSPYIHLRIREAGTWQGWRKAWAGYADTAGTATTATNASSADYASNSGGLLGHTWTSSGKNVRAQEFYVDGWFRNYNSGYGLYNEATANHFYSDGQYWNVGYGGTTGIRLRNGHAGAIMGYLYGQTDGQFGLLHNGGGWAVRIYSGGSGSLYGTWNCDNLQIGGNQVLHAGNFTSYVPYGYPGWPGYPGTDADGFYGGNWLRSSFTYSNNAPLTGTIVHFPSSGYDLQLNANYNGHGLAFRSRNGDYASWMAWKTVLTDYNYTSYAINRGGDTISGLFYFTTNNGGYSGSLVNGSVQVYSGSNNSAYMSFHKGGHYAVNMGLDADNVLRIGGWSAAANRFQMNMSGDLTMAGNVTAYSDIRLKANIKRIAGALNKVRQLRGVTFTRTDQEDKERVHAGVIAQEMELVHPEVVYEDASGIKHVAYGNTIGLLIEAINELASIVEERLA